MNVQNSNGGSQSQTAASVQSEQPVTNTESGSMLLHEADIQPFANRVQWPEPPVSPESQPASVIESGVNDDGVWVEAKGYFKGSLDYVYETLVNPEIMGPTYLTQNITVDEVKKSAVLTTYTMHVKMRYIMSVEFDIGITIDALYDADENVIGYRYKSTKLSGTRFITRIDEVIIVKKIDDTWFSVELQSFNEATMNKEKETRQHAESLFEYWSGQTE